MKSESLIKKKNKKKAIELYFMLLCRRTLRFKLLCVVCVRETKLGSIKMGKCGGKSSEGYLWKFGGGPACTCIRGNWKALTIRSQGTHRQLNGAIS